MNHALFNSTRCYTTLWLLFACFLCCPASAAEPTEAPAVEIKPDTVVATVGDQPIQAGEVLRLLATALHGNQLAAESRAFALAQALEQVVNRKLVGLLLDQLKFVVPDEDITVEMKGLELKAAAANKTFEAFLAERGLTREAAREQVQWETRWNRFARQTLGDEDVKKYFEAHRRQFDGGEVRASHILLRPTGASSPAGLQALVQRAATLREEITAGKLTFADAARQYSAGPSRLQGGDLGFFPRRDRMVEAFSAAAFALEKGAISPPVVTYFGVHLIQCTDIKPGNKTWHDVRDEALTALAQELFAKLAVQMRAKTKVEYTGALPYLDPTSGQVKAN